MTDIEAAEHLARDLVPAGIPYDLALLVALLLDDDAEPRKEAPRVVQDR